ncbi:hypothetical protein BTW10_17700 [Chromohalobacter japonicus]|uniref:Uncharacterized protein n=1 Tax=Chromohalobacter japonicus TaxID=223900 RepID=A0A1Q8T8D1_9GAMM|nr:hypothetical protein [Chromohalobacter japonicus]OLO09878.1 hypothetical protein BTW10_17700 [Chromohalobacter japonicus]
MQRNERAPLTFLVQPPARKGIAVVDGARFEETATRNLPCYAAPFYVTPSPFSTTNTLIFCVFDRFACRLLATGNHWPGGHLVVAMCRLKAITATA